MPYVFCTLAPPDPLLDNPTREAGMRRITCTDEQGRLWWLTEDSQVGDWLDFVANGGTVEPYGATTKSGAKIRARKRAKS